MASVEFDYEGSKIKIQCNKDDTFKKIAQQFLSKVNLELTSVNFLYDGKVITDMNLTFHQLSNNEDKNRNIMNVLVIESLSNPSSQFNFTFTTSEVSESMKEFAKMAISLSVNEHPDDNKKKVSFIQKMFKEKYGGFWIACLFKDGFGACSIDYYHFCIVIKYKDYKYSIAKIRDDEDLD